LGIFLLFLHYGAIIFTMKYIKVKIGRRKYRVNVDILIRLLSGLLILCAAVGVISFVSGLVNKDDNPSEPLVLASDDPDNGYDASAGVLNAKEYKGTMLAKTKDAGQDYIDSTLFIGDSNTARFIKTASPEGGTFTGIANTIGVVGMGIDAISSLPCMQFSTGMYTMPQAVSILQPERIIITFGTNNLYGSDTDATSFIERYEQQLKNIVAAYPSVDLIVNSIPPVARVRSYPHVTMTQIDAYNRAIADMCTENDWKYLNSAEALKDEKTGFAKDGYLDSDGLHFSQQGLTALFEYIRTHSWIKKDDRPKPLNAIPTIYGVPDGLIQTNPLNNKSFEEEPVEEPAVQATPVPTPTPEPEEDEEKEETPEPAETTAPTQETAEKHEHKYELKESVAPTCGTAGSNTYVCSCGDTYTESVPATGAHTWGEWTIVQNPTYEADGIQERQCSVCGAKETQAIPKLEPAPEPDPVPSSVPEPEAPSEPESVPAEETGAVEEAVILSSVSEEQTETAQPAGTDN